MKRIILFATLILGSSLLHSCVLLTQKKHTAMLAERDSLAAGWDKDKVNILSLKGEIAKLKSDTTKLYSQIADLKEQLSDVKSEYTKLKASYNALLANSSIELKRISEELAQREARLKEVEEMLRRRNDATNGLKERLQEALLGFTKNGLAVEVKNGKVYVSLTDKLLFNTGSIVIDEKGKEALLEVAKVLNTQPNINVLVEGHTDNQKVFNLGQIKDNWDLSVLRATSVVRFLTDIAKMDSSRITASGRGDIQPIDPNNTTEAWGRNRRIEIVLSPKMEEVFEMLKD